MDGFLQFDRSFSLLQMRTIHEKVNDLTKYSSRKIDGTANTFNSIACMPFYLNLARIIWQIIFFFIFYIDMTRICSTAVWHLGMHLHPVIT